MITVFRTGEFDYSDSGIDKPVRYNVDNLIEVASRTSTIDVTDEHKKDVLSTMSNFIVKDGMLMADEPNNLELKGMGFSPVFNFDLVDCGDYYEPSNIKMTEIGYTKNPRTHIVYNEVYSDNSPNGEVKNNMDDSEIQKLVKRNNELQEEIGVLKNTNKQLNKAIKDKDKEIKSIKESYSDVDTKINEYDHLKEIETNYNKLISSKRDDLIREIVGEDKDKAKNLEHLDIKDLENIKDLMTGDSAPVGLTPNQVNDDGVPLDDGNIPTPTDDGDVMSKDDVVKFYEEEFGEKPSFIQD